MTETTHATPGASDADAEATEGRVYNVAGGDWDELVTNDDERSPNEQIVVNMGPQHPSTHGVLRLVLTLEGETVTDARASIGYLHTGIEKNMEYRTWTQGIHVHHPGRLPHADLQRDRVLHGGRAAARDRGQDPRARQAHPGAAARAEPDRLAPGRHRPVRPGARRDHDLPAGRPDAGERPRPVRADHRAADEPRVRPARRRGAGPAGRRHRGGARLRTQGTRVDP